MKQFNVFSFQNNIQETMSFNLSFDPLDCVTTLQAVTYWFFSSLEMRMEVFCSDFLSLSQFLKENKMKQKIVIPKLQGEEKPFSIK